MDIIQGIQPAAANAYDGAHDERAAADGEARTAGLKREQGDMNLEARVMDGFNVRFHGDRLSVHYHGGCKLKETHNRNEFENGINQHIADVVKYLKKEYRRLGNGSVTLSPIDEARVDAQSISRIRTFIQAQKAYKIGGVEGVDPIGQKSDKDRLEDNFKKFLELSTDKRPPNDKSKKNPDTPEA